MTDINIDIDTMKTEIMEELRKSGTKVIPSVYNGNKEAIKKFAKFDKYIKEYNDNKKKIEERYAPNIAIEKISNLDIDLMAEKSILKDDLDDILKKEIQYKQQGIKNNTCKPEYKEARKEALDILLTLGNKLDMQTTMEIIKPIVEAKDLTTLKVLKETSSKEAKYLYTGAIREVEQYLSTSELDQVIKDMKQYINNNGKHSRSIILENFIYNNDRDYYNSLRG